MAAAAISVAAKAPRSISRRLLRQPARYSSASEMALSRGRGGDCDGFHVGRIFVDCVVVGGGISGLCVAQALATRHAKLVPQLLLTEARDRVGGNISTIERNGYLWEEGPNSFQPSDEMLSLAVDNGLKDELVFGDSNAPRFVLWNGKLLPVPLKPTDLPFFELLSLGGKLRAGFGAFGIRPSPPLHEETVEEFVKRNLGDEVFERLVEPFCTVVLVLENIFEAAPPRKRLGKKGLYRYSTTKFSKRGMTLLPAKKILNLSEFRRNEISK